MTMARGCAAAVLGLWMITLAGALAPAQAFCPTECKRTDPKVGYCIEYGPVGELRWTIGQFRLRQKLRGYRLRCGQRRHRLFADLWQPKAG